MDERKLVAILDDVMPDLRTMGPEEWTNGTVEDVLLAALRRAASVGEQEEVVHQFHVNKLRDKLRSVEP